MKQTFFDLLPKDLWNDGPVLVGVSGGPDSVCLLLLLKAAIEEEKSPSAGSEKKILVAHFDHRWREESKEEAKWVKRLSEKLGLEFVLGTADQTQKQNLPDHQTDVNVKAANIENRPGGPNRPTAGLGLEGQARDLRYQFFESTMERYGCRYMMTAHHRDDQMETILMRLLRGTSVDGLSGIKPMRALASDRILFRPLLSFSQTAILKFLKESGVDYLTDPSNKDLSRTRNRVRHQLIPHLSQQFGESALEAIVRIGASAQENESQWLEILESYQEALLVIQPGMIEIKVGALPAGRGIVKRLARQWWQKAGFGQREMSRLHWERLADLMIRPEDTVQWPANAQFPGPIFASRSKGVLRISYQGPKSVGAGSAETDPNR